MASVINQIKLGTTEYAIAASAYAECSTAAGTTAKVATICTDSDTTNTAFTLVKGVSIQVKFSNTNSASNPTLNVNSTGAKSIYYKGASITASYLKANYIYTFVYNGTQWELVGEINTDADTKNTAGSTDTDSKIFLIGATSQAANPQTYSHEEVYVDSNHVLTDTVGFKAGSPMYCTTYKANSISYIDGNNVKAGTLNLPTDEDGTFTIATKEWTNTQLDDITDSISDIEQGMLTNSGTNIIEHLEDDSVFELYSTVKDIATAAEGGQSTVIRAGNMYVEDRTNGNSSFLNPTYLSISDQQGEGTDYGMHGIRKGRETDYISIPVAAKTNDTFATQGWVENGYAAKSHGTHVSYSSTAPKANGTASVGTASTVSRSDHVHPTDTSRAASTHTHGNIANDGTLSTASRVVVTDTNKKVTTSSSITTTELEYLDGVTSNIQTQLNNKAAFIGNTRKIAASGISDNGQLTIEAVDSGCVDITAETSDGLASRVFLNDEYISIRKEEPVNQEESSNIQLYNDQLDISVYGPANTTEDYDSEITSGISVSSHNITIGDINGLDNDPEYDEMEVDIDADRVNLNATYAQVNNSKIMTASDFIYDSSTGILTINTSWED